MKLKLNEAPEVKTVDEKIDDFIDRTFSEDLGEKLKQSDNAFRDVVKWMLDL